jgi:hypothetical protein
MHGRDEKLVRKSKGKRRASMRRRKDNIRMNFKGILCKMWTGCNRVRISSSGGLL